MSPGHFGIKHNKASGKPYRAIANQHLALLAKISGTQKDKGKSMMHVFYILQLAKGASRDEATSNSEEIKPVALSIVELHLAEGIS